MKKLTLALAGVLLVVALILAGCNGGDEEPTATPTGSPGGTATATPTATQEPTPTATEQADGSLDELLQLAGGLEAIKYDQIITSPGMEPISSTVWLKGNKMRTETTAMGQTTISIMDGDAQTMYMYMPAQNMATQVDLGQAPESAVESTTDLGDYDTTILGSEAIDGKDCTIVQYTVGGDTGKMWIWKEHGFPLKVEVTTAQGTSTIEYKNIDLSPIPDSMFELPEGVQVIQL